MKIDSINIESFGGLKNFRLDFCDGMNIIYGDNEAGKSTIMAFIEMMFYGRTAQEKSSDISKSLRKKYTPWDGSAMCGELEFTCAERSYRIRKVFKKTIKTDDVKLYDAQTGQEIELGRDEEIGHRFFGIDVGSFEKSVFISGFGGFTNNGQTNEDIAVKLSNLVTTMDESVSQSKVVGRLTKAKELLRSKSGSRGILIELDEQKKNVKDELTRTQELIERQTEYQAEKGRLDERLTEAVNQKEVLKKLERKAALEAEKLNINAENDRLRADMGQLKMLREEGIRLFKERDLFRGKNYSYDTASEYINHADELNHAASAKRAQVEELKGKLTKGDVIDRKDVSEAAALEAKKEKLMLLNERISSAYKPAYDEKKAAEKAEADGRKVLEGIKDISKTNLIRSAAAMLAAVIFAVLTFTVSKFFLIGAFLTAGMGALLFGRYKRQTEEHDGQVAQGKEIAERLSKESRIRNNNFEREKERLFDRGAWIYPDINCDYETITRENLRQCCVELESIYQRYGVKDKDELNDLFEKNEVVALNQRMYENAVKELERDNAAYAEYAGEDNPEEVRRKYAELRDKLSTYAGRLKGKEIDEENAEAELDERIKKLETELGRNDVRLAETDAEIDGLTGIGNAGMSIEEVDALIEDIRGQQMELLSLMQSPEHDENELKMTLSELSEEYNVKKELYDALVIAEENMQAAVDDISRSFGPVLNEKTAEIFNRLTGGRYDKVMVDKEYSIQAKQKDGVYHEWKFLSSGTTDQAYLALRLAMTELITENGERLPLMLDDILLQYDEKRMKHALDFLGEYAKDAQILFFTCKRMSGEKVIEL